MEWFYENNGCQAGPVSREEILRLIMQQRIRPDTLVWTPEFGDVWRPANAAGLVSPLTGLLRLSSGISEQWAWVLLAGPWLIQRLTLLILDWRGIPDDARAGTVSIVALMSLVLFFTAFTLDRNSIRENGQKPPGFWWWLFLPGYFWRRRQVVGRGLSLLLVSLVLFAVNVTERIYQLPQIESEIQARQEQSHPQVTPPASSKPQVNGQEDEQENL
ncbi:DUF4339 domain-containing protein [Gluconobacter kanchanaburiensis]|uniref:GYF domain-containing protein n=1 Tax=Gluconobacter kanchanaburiensis NBRC 103587 TaxID=1307948 RepID=A0A511B7V2_9PROT|nr:DUF4339 domain-containing protein [Gluconobacter kanchanaburiensis]MBF0861400.1 DUF4339 domain-containing protein [Gluconobacter kanchanaburiensis]GBR68219.1 hypothetical protein AA103587_0691 [Gluconobacter kanchanaburiensis NBRC 103587]GEK95761.1 hypothetical protein GKA01_09580 [Gluconobacter kanchanaburiensis NBRC 103587]